MPVIMGQGKTKFVIVLFFLGMMSSCKKKDYRDDYVGNFQFTTTLQEFVTDTTFNTSVINYLGTIGYASAENEISINYRPDITFNVILETDGTLSPPNSGLGSVSGGKFETKDKIRFGSATGTGGAGTYIQDVTGIRK